MIARLYRPLVTGLLPVALIACMNSPPSSAEPGAAAPLGIDLGGSGPVIASAPAAAAPCMKRRRVSRGQGRVIVSPRLAR